MSGVLYSPALPASPATPSVKDECSRIAIEEMRVAIQRNLISHVVQELNAIADGWKCAEPKCLQSSFGYRLSSPSLSELAASTSASSSTSPVIIDTPPTAPMSTQSPLSPASGEEHAYQQSNACERDRTIVPKVLSCAYSIRKRNVSEAFDRWSLNRRLLKRRRDGVEERKEGARVDTEQEGNVFGERVQGSGANAKRKKGSPHRRLVCGEALDSWNQGRTSGRLRRKLKSSTSSYILAC